MNETLWYLGRGTGVVSLVMLTIVVALGIATTAGRPVLGLPRFVVTAVHRSSSLLAISFVAVHVITLLLDPLAQLTVVDVVLPVGGVWLGLGTVAFDLLIALVITSLLRHRIGLRGWKAVHWAAYVAWPVALLHTLGGGSDAGSWWLRGLAFMSFCTVVGAIGYRAWIAAPQPQERSWS